MNRSARTLREARRISTGDLNRSRTFFFFFNDTATTEIYTLSLHDALPTSPRDRAGRDDLPLSDALEAPRADRPEGGRREPLPRERPDRGPRDRRGDRRGALPGAGAARAERARRGSGPREDPRPGAAASAVAAPSVGAQLRQPLLPRGAPPPGDERYVRRHDPRGGPRVSPGRPPRRAARDRKSTRLNSSH